MAKSDKQVKVVSLLAGADLLFFQQDGTIDIQRTVSNISEKLIAEQEQNREIDSKIEAEVDDLFDRMGTDVVDSGTVIAMVGVTLAGGNPAMVADCQKKVQDFLKRSPRFAGKRGRSGGMGRIS